jgi:hypothetical protein
LRNVRIQIIRKEGAEDVIRKTKIMFVVRLRLVTPALDKYIACLLSGTPGNMLMSSYPDVLQIRLMAGRICSSEARKHLWMLQHGIKRKRASKPYNYENPERQGERCELLSIFSFNIWDGSVVLL